MPQPLRFLRRPRQAPATLPADADAGMAAARARTAPRPGIVWIELTSRCPYDCPFCSRRTLRGNGVNMNFELYSKLIAQLDRPAIIRLNYSGESVHHPRIVDAVRLAAATRAWVELVSVPAALTAARLAAIVAAGLNRLTISLHTLDPARYDAIYRFGTLDRLLAGVREAAALRGSSRHPFVVDLAFVAMARNLQELPTIATLAQDLGIPVLAVHPLIRRSEIDERFAAEVDAGGQVTPSFSAALAAALAAARSAAPGVAIQVSAPDPHAPAADPGTRIVEWATALPAGLAVHSCDQDPFDTLHILADGTVVTCEVRDGIPVGNVATATLDEIWHGSALAGFRAGFAAARDAACAQCAYRKVHRPAPLAARITPADNTAQLLRGWHATEDGLVWSRRDALLVLARTPRARSLALRGMLPPGPEGGNTLTVFIDDAASAVITNASAAVLSVDARIALPPARAGVGEAGVRLTVAHAHSPPCGRRVDTRELGFALLAAEIAR